jgi:hypothetical protein
MRLKEWRVPSALGLTLALTSCAISSYEMLPPQLVERPVLA